MKTTARRRFGRLAALALMVAIFLSAGMAQDAPKKISKTDGLNAVTSKVAAPYPVIARQLKIEGAVELEALVTETGAVEKVDIVSGNPVLTKPAAAAVKQWKFAPFTSDGKAVKALVPVSMSFKL